MTLPSSLPEPDLEPEAEPELSRVTVVVGGQQVDVGLPSHASIAALAEEVIELATSQLAVAPNGAGTEFQDANEAWTFARLGAEPLDANRSLAECNVCDGEILVIRKVGVPFPPMLFDDVTIDAEAAQRSRLLDVVVATPSVVGFALSVVASVTAALLVAREATSPVAAAVALAIGVTGALAAAVVGYRTPGATAPPWLASAAIPLLFAGSLHVVPHGFGVSSLPIAFGLTGLVALVTLLVSRRDLAFYTGLIAFSVLGVATTIAVLLWEPAPRTLGALLATASVIVIYLAPRVTIVLSKLPLPPVPTAGEPLDDIETQGGTAVEGVNAVGKQLIPTEEGVIDRVRPSNQYLTGIVAAATVSAVIGTYLAIDVSNGFFWQGTAFAITVATVLCLRGRSHYDLVQSATLIGGGLLTAVALIGKTAVYLTDWRVDAALALALLVALVMACGLIAPRLQFSPVMKRQLEILEYIAIATLFPLCFWIIRLYAFFRELRI